MISPCSAPIAGSVKSFYPTPPPSPDLELGDAPCVQAITPVQAAPLTPRAESELEGFLDNEAVLVSPEVQKPIPAFPPIPIELVLDTPHHLPHATAFRLTSPTGILAALGGNRVLALDSSRSLWDRMPYNAAATVVATPDASEEDQIEAMLGGERPEMKMNGIHWALRSHKSVQAFLQTR